MEENRRLDESWSAETFSKSLTGNSNVSIDLNRIQISPSGQVQPAHEPSPGHVVIQQPSQNSPHIISQQSAEQSE
jgi:hypothetical protein